MYAGSVYRNFFDAYSEILETRHVTSKRAATHSRERASVIFRGIIEGDTRGEGYPALLVSLLLIIILEPSRS